MPLQITVRTTGDQDVVLHFGADSVALTPSASWSPFVHTISSADVDMHVNNVMIDSTSPVGGVTSAAVAVDHDGSGPIVGDALIQAGATVTISVNGGAPVTIGNGPFSLPV